MPPSVMSTSTATCACARVQTNREPAATAARPRAFPNSFMGFLIGWRRAGLLPLRRNGPSVRLVPDRGDA